MKDVITRLGSILERFVARTTDQGSWEYPANLLCVSVRDIFNSSHEEEQVQGKAEAIEILPTKKSGDVTALFPTVGASRYRVVGVVVHDEAWKVCLKSDSRV